MLRLEFVKKVLVLCFLSFSISTHLFAKEYMCFVPGASGGTSGQLSTWTTKLIPAGVPFLPFVTGTKGSVQYRAQMVVDTLEKKLQEDPDLQCHMVGLCFGAIVGRYAYHHLYVMHPQKGLIPIKDLVISYTSLEAPHLGTPLADAWVSKASKLVNSGAFQMGEGQMSAFNDPESPFYSPIPEDIPVYSYATITDSPRESIDKGNRYWGYRKLSQMLRQSGRMRIHDGVVPLGSQYAGVVIAELHLPHGFFSADFYKKNSFTAFDFYRLHWDFLQDQTDEHLERLRDFFYENKLQYEF